MQSGPLPHGWAPFHIEPTFTHRGSAQRRGSITCFSRQEGWTDFYPKRRNETRLPGPFHYQDLSGVVLTRCRLLSVYVIICLKCEFYVWKSSVLLENSICLLALHDEEDNRDLTGPHRHTWLNADEQGVDARRYVAIFEVEVLSIYGCQSRACTVWRAPGFRRPQPAC